MPIQVKVKQKQFVFPTLNFPPIDNLYYFEPSESMVGMKPQILKTRKMMLNICQSLESHTSGKIKEDNMGS